MAGFGTELYWFNGPTGVTNQGSLGNGTYANGMGVVTDTDSGGVSAFSFAAASSQYISLPTRTNLASGTIGFWMRTLTAGRQAIYTEHLNDSNFASLDIGGNSTGSYADESMSFATVTSASVRRAVMTREGTDAYQSGSWVHVVITVDNTSRTVYVDGTATTVYEPFGTTANFFTNVSVSSVSVIGRRFFTGSPLYFDGKLDDVRVLSSVLTGTNVSDWYAGGRGFGAAVSTIRRQSAQTIIRGAF